MSFLKYSDNRSDVIRALTTVSRAGEAAVREWVRKLGFEVRDAELAASLQVFDFHSPVTRNFLASSRAFFARGPIKKGNVTTMTIGYKRLANAVLADHLARTVQRQESHLTARQGGQTYIAIPTPDTQKNMSARARVRKKYTPAGLLAPGGLGFVSKSGKAIVARYDRRSRDYYVAYGLKRAPVNPPRFPFFDIARKAVEKAAVPVMERLFARIRESKLTLRRSRRA
jgi:hypothetical protein